MNIEQTKDAITVMQHFANGGTVELLEGRVWREIADPEWDWAVYDYRIKAVPKMIFIEAWRGKTGRVSFIEKGSDLSKKYSESPDWIHMPEFDSTREISS